MKSTPFSTNTAKPARWSPWRPSPSARKTMPRPPKRPWSLIPALLLSLSGCLSPSYPKDRLEESVREICRKEYGLEVTAHLVGKTLYCRNVIHGLVGDDLDMEPKKFEALD